MSDAAEIRRRIERVGWRMVELRKGGVLVEVPDRTRQRIRQWAASARSAPVRSVVASQRRRRGR